MGVKRGTRSSQKVPRFLGEAPYCCYLLARLWSVTRGEYVIGRCAVLSIFEK